MTKEKKSTKPIPKYLKGKKRYIKFKIITNQTISEKQINETINETIATIFGDYGIAQQKIWLIEWNEKEKTGIIRCSLETIDKTKAGLLFIQEIKGEKVIPTIIKVSGTIKKLKK